MTNTFINQQKQQKISDRIQEKLNIIKNGYDTTVNGVKSVSNDMMKRRDHTPITGKKIKSASTTDRGDNNSKLQPQQQPLQRVSLINNKPNNNESNNQSLDSENNKQNQRSQYYEFNNNNRNSNSNISKQGSKFLKSNGNPNKSNFTINDSRTTNDINQTNPVSNSSMIISQKQMGNKSVLIVKPNQFGQTSNDSANLSQSRNSKRKIYDNNDSNKQNRFSLNKDNGLRDNSNLIKDNDTSQMRNSKVSNFFRVDNNQSLKGQQIDRIGKRVDSGYIGNAASRISQSLQGSKTTTSLSKKGSSSIMTKMRSSSTRVSRKQQIPCSSNTSISKNYSYTSKGKWKF